jgi:hypothetical protein
MTSHFEIDSGSQDLIWDHRFFKLGQCFSARDGFFDSNFYSGWIKKKKSFLPRKCHLHKTGTNVRIFEPFSQKQLEK